MEIHITVAGTELSVVIRKPELDRDFHPGSACWRAETLLAEPEDLTAFAVPEAE